MAKKKVPAAQKAAKKSSGVPTATARKIIEMKGHDPRNGTVWLRTEGKGFRLTNDRTGYNDFFNASTKAIDAYNFQINNSGR